MKKTIFLLSIIAAQQISAQYLSVGSDSISLKDFKEKNAYSLQNGGVDATLKNVEDFMLLQNFAKEKKADTASVFRGQIGAKMAELKKNNYFPPEVTAPLLTKYLEESKTQKEVLFFYKEKSAEDKTDYAKIYQDVVSGKMTMDQAITQYTKTKAESIFIKPGTLDPQLFSEISSLSPGKFTKLINNQKIVAFAQFIANRPSPGYVAYNSISYKNDAGANATKDRIFSALKSGKKFEEVAALYGSNEEERTNAGLILGNPPLPKNIYDSVKNLKIGDYSQPILVGDKYFVFRILDIMPYAVTEKNRPFYTSEMLKTNYQDLAYGSLINYVKEQKYFTETADFQKVIKSSKEFNNFANSAALMYKIGPKSVTFADLKKSLAEINPNYSKFPDSDWKLFLQDLESQDILEGYEMIFEKRPDVKNVLDDQRRLLYADFVFNKYLKGEIDAHPEWKTEYYNSHKNLFMWDERAKSRIAFIKDPAAAKIIQEKIKNPANWGALKKEWYGKLTPDKEVVANFQEGETSKNADIFTKYEIPFQKGVFAKKIQNMDVVVAVDDVLAPSPMSAKDADTEITDALMQKKMEELTAKLRSTTKITVDKAFMDDLLKNFKK